MRAGPLSDVRVVELLNAHFVPVYTSNEDYRGTGCAPPAERKELQRIQLEGHQAGLSVGTVHAYVLSPDGHTVDSRHVAQAAKPRELIAMLEAAVKRYQVPAGAPLVKPRPQSAAPACEAGGLVLHVVARSVRGAGWGGPPGEDWVTYTPEDAAKWLPAGPAAVGTAYAVDRAAAEAVLTHFYPETENNDVKKNRIDELELRGTVVSVRDGVARARLEGRLRMKHPFYHKDDDRFVDATVLGYVDFDVARRRVVTLKLATDRATYGPGTFAVAVRSER
jgi:hypothetical protein